VKLDDLPPLPDPPVGAGQTCATCGKPLPRGALLHDDPFCRVDCCRAWHTVEHRVERAHALYIGLARAKR
jgi:hypothetical protein